MAGSGARVFGGPAVLGFLRTRSFASPPYGSFAFINTRLSIQSMASLSTKNNAVRCFLASVFLLTAGMSLAMAESVQVSRRVEEKKREILDEAPSREIVNLTDYSFEFGGWVNYRFADYNDLDNDASLEDSFQSSLRADTRLWGKITRKGGPDTDSPKEYIYIRLKNIYTELSGADTGERYDNEGPLLDYAYVGLDHKPWKIEVGRKYFNIGRGIAYSGVHDGVQVNYQQPGWNLAGFVSTLPPHTENMDTSIPGYDKESRRYFAGAGAGFAGIEGHQFYGYTVIERDDSSESPEDPLQDYAYDAQYFGLGSKGQWAKGWPYWLEVIRETGHSREDISNAQSNISAWALDAEQKFVTPFPSRLAFSVEAAAGSGDNDRLDVSNTINGNGGGRDHGFVSFGYLPTGIALDPALSNLRMLRAGIDLNPFYTVKALRSFSIGVDLFRYWKDRAEGAISDLDAQNASKDIGQEVDVRVDWWINQRILVSAEWGVFMPGKAYTPAEARTEAASLSMSVIF